MPLGIVVAVRLVPAPVLEECRTQAEDAFSDGRPVSRAAAVVIGAVWLLAAVLVAAWAFRILRHV